MLIPDTAEGWIQLSKNDKGRLAEDVVRHVLVYSSMMHVPLCRIDDAGAPRMTGDHDAVLPDYKVTTRSVNLYLDVKCKTRSVIYYRANNEERHGLDRDLFREYQRCAWFDRSDVGVAIIELCRVSPTPQSWSGAILMGSFRTLGCPLEGCGDNSGKFIYWPRWKFKEVCRFTPSQMADGARGTLPRGWSKRQELEQLFAIPTQIQGELF